MADEWQLLAQRIAAIAGKSLAELAQRYQRPVPANSRQAKGWMGQLIEVALGAQAGSLPIPDFPKRKVSGHRL